MRMRFCFVLLFFTVGHTQAQLAPSFTYQGELRVSGLPANGDYDFEFELYDDSTGGDQIGASFAVDDVTVDEGVFSVELDFGYESFDGTQLWLEVGVRNGDQSGGYTGLLPRQKITAAPYSLHAETVAANAIAGAEIANNTVTAADIAGNAIGASELANNAVDTSAVQNDAITAAKLAANSVGSSQVVNNSLTAADLGANSVAASELAPNAVNTSALQDSAITSAKLAENSVGGSKIVPSQVQRRVNGTCGAWSYLLGINEDGAVICEALPLGASRTLDRDGYVGRYSSVAIGNTGLPIISYYDVRNGDLKVYRCSDAACRGG